MDVVLVVLPVSFWSRVLKLHLKGNAKQAISFKLYCCLRFLCGLMSFEDQTYQAGDVRRMKSCCTFHRQ